MFGGIKLKYSSKILTIIWAFLCMACGSESNSENGSKIKMDEHNPVSQIEISDTSFAPVEIVIPRGTEITWLNKDDEEHSIKNSLPESFLFESGRIAPEGSYSFSFTQRGTFEYLCTLHPQEKKGIIIVK
jgi:plastocyanin